MGSRMEGGWSVRRMCCVLCLVAQLCVTLCNPMDCSLPGCSVHGILQAIPEWVAISSSRGSSQPRDQTQVSCIAGDSLLSAPPGKPYCINSGRIGNYIRRQGIPGGLAVKNSPANAGDKSLIPGLERFPGGGNSYPLQDSCLGNPMDGEPGGQQSTGSQKSWIQLSD